MEATHIVNFGAGPAKLPREVLEEIQREMLSYNYKGISITELSHRSPEYEEINTRAQNTLRFLLNIPDNYTILFVAGGGQGQFAAVPLNFIGRTGSADYLVTGIWSKVAAEEAKNHGNINIAVDVQEKGTIPHPTTWRLNSKASYVYYCDNDTIEGVEFPYIPATNDVPLVADMSSSLLTKQIDVSKFGVIFAASQKNLGTAGIAVVIVRRDLLGHAKKHCPNIMNYTILSEYNSILNTPPVFSIYVLDKILQWVKRNGGVEKMEYLCKQKSQMVYNLIDNAAPFYYPFAEESVRSRINISFRIGKTGVQFLEALNKKGTTFLVCENYKGLPLTLNGKLYLCGLHAQLTYGYFPTGHPVLLSSSTGIDILEEKFLEEAEHQNMFQLKGHRLVGGIRISLFNSITIEEVQMLLKFMSEFEKKYKHKIGL